MPPLTDQNILAQGRPKNMSNAASSDKLEYTRAAAALIAVCIISLLKTNSKTDILTDSLQIETDRQSEVRKSQTYTQ